MIADPVGATILPRWSTWAYMKDTTHSQSAGAAPVPDMIRTMPIGSKATF